MPPSPVLESKADPILNRHRPGLRVQRRRLSTRRRLPRVQTCYWIILGPRRCRAALWSAGTGTCRPCGLKCRIQPHFVLSLLHGTSMDISFTLNTRSGIKPVNDHQTVSRIATSRGSSLNPNHVTQLVASSPETAC